MNLDRLLWPGTCTSVNTGKVHLYLMSSHAINTPTRRSTHIYIYIYVLYTCMNTQMGVSTSCDFLYQQSLGQLTSPIDRTTQPGSPGVLLVPLSHFNLYLHTLPYTRRLCCLSVHCLLLRSTNNCQHSVIPSTRGSSLNNLLLNSHYTATQHSIPSTMATLLVPNVSKVYHLQLSSLYSFTPQANRL